MVFLSTDNKAGGGGFTVPTIVLKGDNPYEIIENSKYQDPGYSVTGFSDGDKYVSIDSSKLNTRIPGTYEVKYKFNPPNKKLTIEVIRSVIVVNKTGGILDPLDDVKDKSVKWIKSIFTKKK